MKIYDISLTVTPALPVWPGDPSDRAGAGIENGGRRAQ